MAIGNTSPTKRQLHELQQTSEHNQCRVEPESEQCCDEQIGVPAAGQLAKRAASVALVFSHGRTFHLEISAIQAEVRISGDGLLPNHGERSRRNP